ncbi:MAG: hypothetical protein POELPBGB_00762 [Bacteroidia bacterium]|nr:hypothetical protein [Bacteroidia bacterium]
MRKAEFNVPSEVMVAFAEELVNSNLNNTITGVCDDEITIEVEYDKEESREVDKLEEILDSFRDEEEE